MNPRWYLLEYNALLYDSMAYVLMTNKENYLVADYDWNHASTGAESPGLSFDSNYPIFPPALFGHRLVVIVQCWFDMGDNQDEETIAENSGYGFVQFYVNIPPDISDLQIAVTPNEGVALETKFKISCEGGSTQMIPLRYSIGFIAGDIIVDGVEISIQLGMKLARKCTWISIRGISYLVF